MFLQSISTKKILWAFKWKLGLFLVHLGAIYQWINQKNQHFSLGYTWNIFLGYAKIVNVGPETRHFFFVFHCSSGCREFIRITISLMNIPRLELWQYKNGFVSVKRMLFLKLPPCRWGKKGANFKTNIIFTDLSPFLYYLSSNKNDETKCRWNWCFSPRCKKNKVFPRKMMRYSHHTLWFPLFKQQFLPSSEYLVF